ncbi:ECF transporter S component [Mycoplasmatota bacterium]|nr:ECF transporter S component [Mycoplasmatota bacterium]
MKKMNELQKLLLAVSLTSISVVIDVLIKYVIPIETFGLPFYAIPIVIGSIVLGPIYGVMMALIGDSLGVMMSGYGYLFLYSLAAVSWGVIPSLIVRNKYHFIKLAVGVFIAYICASLSNTFANFYYFGEVTAYATLFIRLALIIPNSVVIILMVHFLYQRLYAIFPTYLAIGQLDNTH